jgi:exosortase
VKPDALRPHAGWLLVAHAACFWPVWGWYLARMDDGSDEPWALVALLAAVALGWPRDGFRLDRRDPLLRAATVLTVGYAALAPFAPPLLRALCAMAALGCSWISVSGTRARAPALIWMLLLSVPVIASLQFYAGYPLRVLTASGATSLLDVFGADVVRSGTSMSEHGQLVLVDAPCSGVRMLWTASLLCAVLAAMRRRVGWAGLAFAQLCVLPIVLAVNSLRAALLFLLETAAEAPPTWLHSLVGVFTFVVAGALVLASESAQVREWRPKKRAPRLASS